MLFTNHLSLDRNSTTTTMAGYTEVRIAKSQNKAIQLLETLYHETSSAFTERLLQSVQKSTREYDCYVKPGKDGYKRAEPDIYYSFMAMQVKGTNPEEVDAELLYHNVVEIAARQVMDAWTKGLEGNVIGRSVGAHGWWTEKRMILLKDLLQVADSEQVECAKELAVGTLREMYDDAKWAGVVEKLLG
jgi:hypothetical protein